MADPQMDLNKSITQCLEQISITMKRHLDHIQSMEARLMMTEDSIKKLEEYYEDPESELDKSYGGTK
tara:strand:- start:279 stop:479 length:201 start_codon:yes stop_codon:yes gene_type:complete